VKLSTHLQLPRSRKFVAYIHSLILLHICMI
jgi:hypothetical protein